MFRSRRPQAHISLPFDDPDLEKDRSARSSSSSSSRARHLLLLAALSLTSLTLLASTTTDLLTIAPWPFPTPAPAPLPSHIIQGLEFCKQHSFIPGPPSDFHQRTQSERFVPGTKAVLIKNATIWTGNDNGNEVIKEGEVLLEGGILKSVGGKGSAKALLTKGVEEVDAKGAWVTPGIVDMHSHAGIGSAPAFGGTDDGNSLLSDTNPYLRSLDGINTHDVAFPLIIAGGTTTSLILPGSADAIGGQGYVLKFRPTSENSVSVMLLEPPFEIAADGNWTRTNHARHFKHAFGENPSRVYGQTRMDTQWDFRNIYNQARLEKVAQDDWCSSVEAALEEPPATPGAFAGVGKYPQSSLRLEALVDTLRGKVLVNAHCYEATDLDALIRLSNEFKFHVSAVHHAHEAHIVPDVLKKGWGGPPGAAIFAAFSRYKHEAYRHSVHSPKILADAGIKVAMKSDHSAVNSRYVLHEAVQAHYYGLEANLALAAVTSTPATLIGKGHRIGYLRPGYDADVVIWQSHPLQLGATPSQVYVDGIPQLSSPHLVPRPASDQRIPLSANYTREIAEVISTHGDPSFEARKRVKNAVFLNVRSVVLREGGELKEIYSSSKEVDATGGLKEEEGTRVVMRNGRVDCVGECVMSVEEELEAEVVDLKGGSIGPGLTSFGTNLGLLEIDMEASTVDAGITTFVPGLLPTGPVSQASDGLVFGGKEMLIDVRAGITKSISLPYANDNFITGYNAFISLGAENRLSPGAVIDRKAGLSITIGHTGTPVSLQISLLRGLLEGKKNRSEGALTPLQEAFVPIIAGDAPLVLKVHSADQMATLLELKADAEALHKTSIRFVFHGAAEAHLLAKEIAKAKVGVIVAPLRGFPGSWEERRVLAGAPLTAETTLSALHAAGVVVAVGLDPQQPPFTSSVSLLRWTLSFILTDSVRNPFTPLEVLAFGTTNIEKLLGVKVPSEGKQDWVAVEYGSLIEAGRSKVVAVGTGDGEKGEVLLF